MSITSVYEQMQKDGKLDTPIRMNQPTPDNPNGGMTGDGDYNKHMKSMLEEKIVEKELNKPETNELGKLKNRVKFLEDSLKIIMEQHMKLMRK